MVSTLRKTDGTAATVALTISLVGMASSSASADADSVLSISLAADTQSAQDRPTLKVIKQQAAQRGITLEQAIADHIAAAAVTQRTTLAAQPDGPVSIPDVMIDDMHATEIEDLKLIAASEGMGLAVAIDKFAWQDEFEKVAGELETTFAGEFAGAVKYGGSAWFGFKGKARAAAAELAKRLPVRVDLVGERGFSEAELATATTATHQAVLANPEVADVATSYDVQTGTVEVQAELPASLSDRRIAAADLAPAQALPAGTRVDVTIVPTVDQLSLSPRSGPQGPSR